jgi:type IV secretory pathway VirB4 component
MNRSYKIESIRDLRNVLARGDARLFSAGIRISVRANTIKRMEADLRRVSQRLNEMGFPVATALRNQRRAFFSALPIGLDLLGQEKFIADRTLHPNMTGETIACLMPNCIVDASQDGGIILGDNKSDGSLVTFNRWRLINPHTVIIATSGSGKTVGQLIEIMREMLKNPDLQAFYIDPQGVLEKFARLVGGTVLDLGPEGNVVINPMDRYVLNGKPEKIGPRLNFLNALFELMTRAELSASERSIVARAVKRLYHHFEEGESMLRLLELTFMSNPLYTPLRPYLRSYIDPETNQRRPGIMTQLKVVYEKLREKHNIPSTGLVAGQGSASAYKRPVCRLGNDNRWYYTGGGETSEQFVDPVKGRSLHDAKPAPVWYPDQEWYGKLAEEFSSMVQDEGIFDSLDLTALGSAIRDSFVELKLGMPILSDLFPFLAAEGATNLVSNLEQYADPEVFGKMFNGFTNVALDRRFISFNVRDLGEELLRPIRISQAINFTWGMVRAVKRPRLFCCDEFGLLVQNFTEVGNYMRDLFMRGRAFGLAMTVIVQNVTSLLDYQAALQCIENADRVILMRQQKTAIHRLKAHYELTDGQVNTLLAAEPGEALEMINHRWLHVKYSADPQHLRAFDTRPDESRSAQDGLGEAPVMVGELVDVA